DGVDPSGDTPQVVITAGTLDLLRIGVDREDLVAAVAQTLEHGIGAVLPGLARHACHGDPLVSEELGSGFLHRRHLPPPSRFGSSSSALSAILSSEASVVIERLPLPSLRSGALPRRSSRHPGARAEFRV